MPVKLDIRLKEKQEFDDLKIFEGWIDRHALHLVNEVVGEWLKQDDNSSILWEQVWFSIRDEDIKEWREQEEDEESTDEDIREQLHGYTLDNILQYVLVDDHLEYNLKETGGIVLPDVWGLTVWCKQFYGSAWSNDGDLIDAYANLKK